MLSKKFKLGFLALILTFASSTSMAVSQYCSGKVSQLWMYSNGDLFVLPSWRGDHVRVCNINQNLGSITPQICASWFTLLRTAVSNKENTYFYYENAPACNIIPTFSNAPVPGYIMLFD